MIVLITVVTTIITKIAFTKYDILAVHYIRIIQIAEVIAIPLLFYYYKSKL